MIFFLIFIGTGNTNVMIGNAWPAISADIGVPISRQGIVIFITYAAAAFGAATVQNLLAHFRTWLPSIGATALAVISIFIFSGTGSFAVIVVCGTILGYSIGTTGAICNGYVARHYSAASMNYLHCFFGAGCTMAPAIISYFLISGDSWRAGFRAIGMIEICIIIVLILSIPLWRVNGPVFPRLKKDAGDEDAEARDVVKAKPIRELMKLPGTVMIVVTVFFYCSYEISINCWTTSFLTVEKGFLPGPAAAMMTLYFGGQIAGRIVCGFLSKKFSDRHLIRVFIIAVLVATTLLLFAPNPAFPVIFTAIGFATGPLFPLIFHEVPSIVGLQNAQGVIGLQAGVANIGNACIPTLIGVVAGRAGFRVFPIFLVVLMVVSVILKTVQDIGVQRREKEGYSV